jgi:hypothetical protein
MSKKSFSPLRIYKEDRDRALKACFELSYIEGKRVSMPELIRRTFNIPGVKDTLIKDSETRRKK